MSQWVDANGDPWRFSRTSRTWQKQVDGVWSQATLPPGGLQRVYSGTTTVATVQAPPWEECELQQQAPEWIDDQGDPWRYNTSSGTWQKLVGSSWVTSSPPSGGLQRIGDAAADPGVVVVETMGPRGPEGPPGPQGPPAAIVSEVLSPEGQDGVNATFSLSNTIDLSQAIQVFRNGLLEIQGHGYLVTATTVTFTTPPLDSDVIAVIYQKAQ